MSAPNVMVFRLNDCLFSLSRHRNRSASRLAAVSVRNSFVVPITSLCWRRRPFTSSLHRNTHTIPIALVDEAAKRVPGTDSGNVDGVRLLSSDQHDIAERVGMESGHRTEIVRKHFAMPGFERLHEIIHCVFRFGLDVL